MCRDLATLSGDRSRDLNRLKIILEHVHDILYGMYDVTGNAEILQDSTSLSPVSTHTYKNSKHNMTKYNNDNHA